MSNAWPIIAQNKINIINLDADEWGTRSVVDRSSKSVRARKSLGVPITAKNRKIAGQLYASVCFSIKMGSFNYAAQFIKSSNFRRFGV
ncbi:Arm DNA-binding domain-containing protein [Leclercia sp. W17]|uniref:Arm DNA-binding domain-containing protein n=1 Tax=Leclercia sp. W17 TaxID=2282309 RepID=UPI00352B3FFF